MTLLIATSFNRDLWHRYAKACVSSWVSNLQGDYRLLITVDGPLPSDLHEVVKDTDHEIILLDNEPEYVRFLKETSHINGPQGVPPEHQFRFEFRRFWPKVFTFHKAVMACHYDYHIWLDADVMMIKETPVETLRNFKPEVLGGVTILDRGPTWGYMDSGFIMGRPGNGEYNFFDDFVRYTYNLYTTKNIFQMAEWHDAWLFSFVLRMMSDNPEYNAVQSLSGKSDKLNPMEDSPLAEYMIHFKGVRKNELQSGEALEGNRKQEIV